MMDYRASNMIVAMTIVAAVSMAGLASAKTIVVGGNIGWEIPPTATTYSDWASNQTFTVGDVLVFNFAGGAHTVAEVTKAAYDGCDTGSIISLHSASPAKITLAKAGQAFFFCSVVGHCDAGMKLAVTVTSRRTSHPAPSPAPAARSAAATATGSSSALLPGPIFAAVLIAATGFMLNEIHTP